MYNLPLSKPKSDCFRILVIKSAPTILYRDLKSLIGHPNDYNQNKSSNSFPDSYDIRIPTAPRTEHIEIPKEDSDAEIVDLTQPENPEPREESQHYLPFKYEEPPVHSQPKSQKGYLPVKCLNTFSTDWAIKVRVTKKGDIKEWKNTSGSGSLFNVDLIDMEGTQIQGTFFKSQATKFFA